MGKEYENIKLSNSKADCMMIKNSHTFIVVPFYYEEGTFTINNWWENEDRVLSDDGFNGELLYPYIMDFLQGNVQFKQNQNFYTEKERSKSKQILKQSLQIYRLKVDDSERGKFWKAFATSTHSIYDSKKGNDKIDFTLYAEEWKKNQSQIQKIWDDFYLPHLFISPIGNVGLLIFHISLSGQKNSIEDLKKLNYFFHKMQGDLHKCKCHDLVGEDAKTYRKYLQWHLEEDLKKNPKQTWNPTNDFTWNSKALVDMLLRDDETVSMTWEKGVFPRKSYKLFSTERTNLLTYGMVNKLMDQIADSEIISELTRLSRCVDNKYLLPHSNPSFIDTYTRLYENIYAAAAIEGTAIIAIPQKNNDDFIQNYHKTSIRKKYVWIYILVMLQRFTLMNLNRQLAIFDASHSDEEQEKTNSDIWDLLKIVRFVKVHSYYTDVSSYSHFFEYYQLCCNNLHINETYREIDNKTKILNLSISHDHAKKEDEEQKDKSRQHDMLERFLAIFGIIQGFQILFEDTSFIWKFCAIAVAIILGCFAPQLIRLFSKKNK